MTALYAAALKWVNDVRADLGAPPLGDLPKGKPCDPIDGPLARATGFLTGPRFAVDLRDPDTLRFYPAEVSQFLHAFDQGAYPNLKEN